MAFLVGGASAHKPMIGTWAKIPSLETIEMLGHAGFDFVVIDMEHAPHSMELAYRLIFAAQAMGMAAFVRLPDRSDTCVQRLLDSGSDGLLVPRVTSPAEAEAITAAMVFSPEGERGLGATSRAGRWGMIPLEEYVRRGNEQCLRMIQLEDWDNLHRAADYAVLPHVNGIFVGLGDLFLSSGRPASAPEVDALAADVARIAREHGILSGIAASGPEDGRRYLEMGYSLVMIGNDATLFGRAAAAAVAATRGR